jgi:hypothetical protein
MVYFYKGFFPMSLSLIEQFVTVDQIESVIDSLPLNKVNLISDSGDVTFKDDNIAGFRQQNFKIMFNTLQESLIFMFSNFSLSEIKSIESMMQFYVRLFPYDLMVEANKTPETVVTMYRRDDSCIINFKLFSIAYRYNKWLFQINDKYNNDIKMYDMSFKSLQMAIITAIDTMFLDIFRDTSLVINNQLALTVANNQTNFGFSTMRYKHLFTYETDMSFAMHIKDYDNFHVVTDKNVKSRIVPRDVMVVSGNQRVEHNILNVAKLTETHISIHNESIELMDKLFSVTFSPVELEYLKKTFEVMRLSDCCYPRQPDTEIQIIRANTGKKTIFNLIREKIPFQFRTGRHSVSISSSISIGFYIEDEYLSCQKIKSFKDAYHLCYNKFIEHVSKTFDIPPEEVTELHFKTLEMSSY